MPHAEVWGKQTEQSREEQTQAGIWDTKPSPWGFIQQLLPMIKSPYQSRCHESHPDHEIPINGVEMWHLMHFCLKCVKSVLEGPWGVLGPRRPGGFMPSRSLAEQGAWIQRFLTAHP